MELKKRYKKTAQPGIESRLCGLASITFNKPMINNIFS
jgi:hypothetical protein